jgi:hypothetical protein
MRIVNRIRRISMFGDTRMIDLEQGEYIYTLEYMKGW